LSTCYVFISRRAVTAPNNEYFSASVFTSLPAGDSLMIGQSELLYDWRITANQFILEPSPLKLTTKDHFSATETLWS
jgi:hypothetical protein